jgi:NAD(P)H-hydrate epimerase
MSPPGLDADTGQPLGVAVKADTTVSFVGLKEGFLKLAAQPHIGDVVVADIGAPRDLIERLGRVLEDHELHDEPPPRAGHERTPPRARNPEHP